MSSKRPWFLLFQLETLPTSTSNWVQSTKTTTRHSQRRSNTTSTLSNTSTTNYSITSFNGICTSSTTSRMTQGWINLEAEAMFWKRSYPSSCTTSFLKYWPICRTTESNLKDWLISLPTTSKATWGLTTASNKLKCITPSKAMCNRLSKMKDNPSTTTSSNDFIHSGKTSAWWCHTGRVTNTKN